jgi:predicted ATPase
MITAEIANTDAPHSGQLCAVDPAIASTCDELAQQYFGADAIRVTSRLADSGVFTALCTDGRLGLAASEAFVQSVATLYGQMHLGIRLAVHSIDAAESSMGSVADARYAHLLRQAAHAGQILISARAYNILHDVLPQNLTLRDLGQHQMPDLSQPAHVFQLLTTEQPHVFPQIRSLNGGRHNLVTPVSRFIGREDDMLAIRDLFRENRMVSLVGAPGIGKTRLAVQTAALMVEDMADGAWFVEIPLLADPALVVPAIAAAIKVVEDPAVSLLESIVCALEHKHILLVIDNCSLVRNACASTIQTIFERCPEVRVLATGTEGVGVQGEVIHTVRALRTPDVQNAAAPLSLRVTEAGELFNDFATRANPEFLLTQANARFVARLVNAAAGIPFALQVVAHAVRGFDVGQMAADLEARVPHIASDLYASHLAVIRSILEWSYGQLDSAAQSVLCRLSVFNGAFTQAAALAVAPGGGRESTRLNDASVTLNALTASGLVTKREQSGVPRYRLPDPVREFADGRLDKTERTRTRKRFVEYYLRMAEDAGADLEGTGAARMALWLEREYPNLCAALAWCTEDPEQAASGLKLAQSLRKYWEVRGYPGEGQALLLGAAVWGDRAERTTARADALKRAGDSAFQSGNFAVARERHQEALSINRQLGDRARQAINLNNLGSVARASGDHSAAQRMHEEALKLNREVGDQRREAVNLHNIANALRDQGEVELARELYEEAITINLKMADHMGIGHNLNSLARLAFGKNDRREALRLYEEALTHFRTGGNQQWVAHNLAEIEKLHLRPTRAESASPLLSGAR